MGVPGSHIPFLGMGRHEARARPFPRRVARVESALGCRSPGDETAAWMLQQDEPSWGTLASLPWK